MKLYFYKRIKIINFKKILTLFFWIFVSNMVKGKDILILPCAIRFLKCPSLCCAISLVLFILNSLPSKFPFQFISLEYKHSFNENQVNEKFLLRWINGDYFCRGKRQTKLFIVNIVLINCISTFFLDLHNKFWYSWDLTRDFFVFKSYWFFYSSGQNDKPL